MSAIAKLRNDFKKERALMRKMISEAGEDMKRTSATPPPTVVPVVVVTATKFKLQVDPTKLEETIKKACVSIEKKNIVILDKPPSTTKVVATHPPVPVAICQAKNLNGTPCKCKAKFGKFCTKHRS